MKTHTSTICGHSALTLATALLGVASGLLGACGGADSTPADPSVQAVVLDMDVLGSSDVAAREAAMAHGAPGEAEPVLYVVRARRADDAARAAGELARRGFATVRVADARDDLLLSDLMP
jgi:hypothetical protein